MSMLRHRFSNGGGGRPEPPSSLILKSVIAFLYISNSKCTGAQLWNSQTGVQVKEKTLYLNKKFQQEFFLVIKFKSQLSEWTSK